MDRKGLSADRFLMSMNTSTDKITMSVDTEDAVVVCRQVFRLSIVLSILSSGFVCGQVVGQNLESW